MNGLARSSHSFCAMSVTDIDVVQLGQRDGEFVAAEARHGVAVAHMALQAPADLLEQQVAGLVAAGVVDFLEVVEVDEQQRQRQCRCAAPS